MDHIYLDYNASCPLAPEVIAAMQPFLTEHFGNPSTSHWAGASAKVAVETARNQIASVLDCNSDEVIITSGGTESNNMVFKGLWFQKDRTRNHFIISAIEHPAVKEPVAFLKRLGATVTEVPVDCYGRVNPLDIQNAITDQTLLVSIMYANNEVGTLQPIKEIAAICHARGILLHTDAAQALGKVDCSVRTLQVDLLTVAGHKLYAPKGIGALYVRRGVLLEPLMHGAGHESGRRAGTENVLLAVGLGAACELARGYEKRAKLMLRLKMRLWDGLHSRLGTAVVLNGHPTECLPNTLNVSFVGHMGADVLAALPGVAASTGSACHAGSIKISPVLAAMGCDPQVARGAVRFSVGAYTTDKEIDRVLELVSAWQARLTAQGAQDSAAAAAVALTAMAGDETSRKHAREDDLPTAKKVNVVSGDCCQG